MKNILTRLQDLRDKADRLQQAAETVPARAARLRNVVVETTGRLQQLRAEFHEIAASLRSDSETSLAETLTELDAGAGVLARAGYELTGLDLEPGAISRVIVHLNRVPEARTTSPEQLLGEASGNRVIHGILTAVVRAEAVEKEVSLSDLGFRGLVLQIGPAPIIRLCWGRVASDGSSAPVPVPPPLPVSAPPPPVAPARELAGFAADSFFGRPESAGTEPSATASPAAPGASEPVVPTPGRRDRATVTPVRRELTGDWRTGALDRFKKMPDLP